MPKVLPGNLSPGIGVRGVVLFVSSLPALKEKSRNNKIVLGGRRKKKRSTASATHFGHIND